MSSVRTSPFERDVTTATGRFLVLAYGLSVYGLFLATFLYMIGFVGGIAVPRTIDDAPFATGALSGIAINAALLGLFAVQHTIMARPAFKRWWTRYVPAAAERSTFVLVTCAILGLLVTQWRAFPGVVWQTDGALALAITALAALGWTVVLVSTFLIDHFDLFGVKQSIAAARGRAPEPPVFRERLFYRYCRHPLMLGFIIAFWAAPTMTWGHLLFAGMTTAYILVALVIEEATLVELHGEAYTSYQRRVSKLIPGRPRA